MLISTQPDTKTTGIASLTVESRQKKFGKKFQLDPRPAAGDNASMQANFLLIAVLLALSAHAFTPDHPDMKQKGHENQALWPKQGMKRGWVYAYPKPKMYFKRGPYSCTLCHTRPKET